MQFLLPFLCLLSPTLFLQGQPQKKRTRASESTSKRCNVISIAKFLQQLQNLMDSLTGAPVDNPTTSRLVLLDLSVQLKVCFHL
jgi:hypothetical protein